MNRFALPSAFALVLAGTMAGTMAFAQQPQPPAPAAQPDPGPIKIANPRKQTSKLAQELNLTPDQTAKVEPILADRDKKIAALRMNTALSPEVIKKQIHLIQKNAKEQLDAILTPQQAEQLKSTHRENGSKEQPQPVAPTPNA